jgi:DnaJ-class molecular chaperone
MDSKSGKGGKKQAATKKLDFYELLELDKSATPEQIKSTYKKLALVTFH